MLPGRHESRAGLQFGERTLHKAGRYREPSAIIAEERGFFGSRRAAIGTMSASFN